MKYQDPILIKSLRG